MSKPNQAPPKRQEIYYDHVRFESGYQAQWGQAHSNQMGRLVCSTEAHPTQYSARWVVGAPVVFVQWLTHQGVLEERDIPWQSIMYAGRIKEGDKPATLAKR